MIKMIKDEWQTWVYMLLATAVVLWIIAFFGCSSPSPPPITYYREACGFTVNDN